MIETGLAILSISIIYLIWIWGMRKLGAFKTKKEILEKLFYICSNCQGKIYWNKPYPISYRECPYCGEEL